MNYKKGKLFRKNDRIINVDYDTKENYYEFIKKYKKSGYDQMILTSDYMICLLNYYFIERGFTIRVLEPIDDDKIISDKFEKYIEQIRENRNYFIYLLNEIEFLSKDVNSVDIYKIELTKRDGKGKTIRVSFQINGIVSISEEAYQNEVEDLIRKITDYSNGLINE